MAPYAFNLLTVTAVVFGLLLLCCGVCWVAGRRYRGAHPDTKEDFSSDFAASTILGLLALILGFTFSLVINRFEFKRMAILNEANAIGTTYLRTRLILDGALGSELRSSLRTYVDTRIRMFDNGKELEDDPTSESEINRQQQQIWGIAKKVTTGERSVMTSILIQSLNEMFDLQNTRSVALHARLPGLLYWVILTMACVAVGASSFSRGYRGTKMLLSLGPVALMIALAFALIQDLDRPQSGFIRIGQSTMLNLRAKMTP